MHSFIRSKLRIPAIGLYRRYGFLETPMADNEYEESDMRMELVLAVEGKAKEDKPSH